MWKLQTKISINLRQLASWLRKKVEKQTVFVLTNVHHKRTRWTHQCTMVPFIRCRQIFNGRFNFWTHYLFMPDKWGIWKVRSIKSKLNSLTPARCVKYILWISLKRSSYSIFCSMRFSTSAIIWFAFGAMPWNFP